MTQTSPKRRPGRATDSAVIADSSALPIYVGIERPQNSQPSVMLPSGFSTGGREVRRLDNPISSSRATSPGAVDSQQLNAAPTAVREAVQSPLSFSNRRFRRIVSAVILLHLIAIVTAPLAMPPASLFFVQLWRIFRPYLDVMYLNHGYHFFAPDPGPSHLIRYELEFDDGSHSAGVFPDPELQTPRLLYHRHFMLSEYANRLGGEDSSRPALNALSASFADHLLNAHRAARVKLFLRRHYIPTPEQVIAGMQLDAPELFVERPLGDFERKGGI